MITANIESEGTPAAAAKSPPPILQFGDLKPSNLLGSMFVALASLLTSAALGLSLSAQPIVWLAGQVLLAIALLQWFAILHEAGHKTLFRSHRLNALTGHLAGFWAGFPFECWKLVHGLHHRWTGWQDLDATTANLVPRNRPAWMRLTVRFCWCFWIPIFSVIYRLDNYWNLPRLKRLFSRKLAAQKRSFGGLLFNAMLLLVCYGLLVWSIGLAVVLRVTGLGVLLSLMMEDLLILSQHTHIPMNVSGGADVAPVPPLEQELFTRSLKFPVWFSRLILLNLDAHELHHMYVQVPGYYLNRIPYCPHNEISWWRWVMGSRRVPGDVLLFQNRNQTGIEI